MRDLTWVGPIFHAGGYGEVSRNAILGLLKLGYPVKAVNLGPDDRSLLNTELLQKLEGILVVKPEGASTVIIHREPEKYPTVKLRRSCSRIGYTIFETDRIPRHWVKLCNRMDEIWVPSRFNVGTFSQSGVKPRKIKCVPYGVDTDFYRPISEQLCLKDKRQFVFLYVAFFDWRKGFDLLLDAYGREFSDRDDVTLVLKVSEDHHLKVVACLADMVGRFRAKAASPHLITITEPFTRQQMRLLYNSCDLYISTDRANGWGMPCMEAMAMGKAAATINWSGSTQFMHEANSLLIQPTGGLVGVDARLAESRPLYSGHRWAEVTVEEVRRVMRTAYGNPNLLSRVAARGMDYVRNHHNLAAAARGVIDAVDSLPIKRRLWL